MQDKKTTDRQEFKPQQHSMLRLESHADFLQALEKSKKESVFIFKHSLSCSISMQAYRIVTTALQDKVITIPTYLLVVQDSPSLKIETAEALHIQHESPQIIILRPNKTSAALNHEDITMTSITNLLSS